MLEIVYKKVADLIPYVNNARVHSESQVNQIVSSMKEFQFTNPILTDGDNGIIAGHGRLIAAKKIGMESVPTVELSHLSPAQKKAYIIADNKLALAAEWDEELLALEFADLEAMDFDLELTGFSLDEIEAFDFDNDETEGLTDPDEVPDVPEEPVSKLGDLWILGKHRVLCGDSTSIDAVDKLMDGKKARLVITDPPYGVSYADKNAYLNAVGRGNRIQIGIEGDHMSKEKTQAMWKLAFSNMANVMDKGAVVYCFMPQGGDQMMMMMMMMMEGAGIEPRHELIWVKNNHVLGRSDYCYKHEPILYAWMKGGHKFYGEFSTSLIECDKPQSSKLHPTMKPVELLEKLVNNSSLKGELLFDPFLGSGSTLIAAEKTNRICFGMELSPHYVDVICQRWANFTGFEPTLESTGQTYNEVKEALNG
jgi:DNA modification methylase